MTGTSEKQIAQLRASFEAAVAAGLLRVGSEPQNLFLVWRYDGVGFRYCVKCYRGKKGFSIVENDEAIGAWIAAGELERVRAEAKPRASRSHPLGTLHLLAAPKAREAERAERGRSIGLGDLSLDQERAFSALLRWVERPHARLLTLGGYAGTGKSTLLGLLARELGDRQVAFCAYTGRAASVLRRKLGEAGVPLENCTCTTIHGLLYEAVADPETGLVIEWRPRPRLDCDLIVVDEASMVDRELFEDLAKHEIPILAVGDHGQLPPVGGDGDLMQRPDLRLEQVHRQAAENPIIALSMAIRGQREALAAVKSDSRVTRMESWDGLEALMRRELRSPESADEIVFLCYYNQTRVRLNALARALLGFTDPQLEARERVICLRNARFEVGLVANGMRGAIEQVAQHPERSDQLQASVRFAEEGLRFEGRLAKAQFGRETRLQEFAEIGDHVRSWDQVGMLFDWGYALTVHKAQGSQFRRVVLCRDDPGRGDEKGRRWLYTAVTRAVDSLVIVGAGI
ncbi:MAG: AAA family ATPase [Planctomycetes bacterium]|nr:AAA family ATPase [Planctomycetota bacterium]